MEHQRDHRSDTNVFNKIMNRLLGKVVNSNMTTADKCQFHLLALDRVIEANKEKELDCSELSRVYEVGLDRILGPQSNENTATKKRTKSKKKKTAAISVSKYASGRIKKITKIINQRTRGDGTIEYEVQFEGKSVRMRPPYFVRKCILDETYDRMDEVEYRYKGYRTALKEYEKAEKLRLRSTKTDSTDFDRKHYRFTWTKQKDKRRERLRRHPAQTRLKKVWCRKEKRIRESKPLFIRNPSGKKLAGERAERKFCGPYYAYPKNVVRKVYEHRKPIMYRKVYGQRKVYMISQ